MRVRQQTNSTFSVAYAITERHQPVRVLVIARVSGERLRIPQASPYIRATEFLHAIQAYSGQGLCISSSLSLGMCSMLPQFSVMSSCLWKIAISQAEFDMLCFRDARRTWSHRYCASCLNRQQTWLCLVFSFFPRSSPLSQADYLIEGKLTKSLLSKCLQCVGV